MRWRLILEVFGPELKYIKGENNVVTDALSRLEKIPNQDILNISELYGYDDEDLPDSAYPIRYHDISKAQETDAKSTRRSSDLVGRRICLTAHIQFIITTLPKHRKLMLNYNKN